MNNSNVKRIALGLLIAILSGSFSYAAQEPVHVKPEIPAEIMTYLKKHEVDASLKAQLDRLLFSDPRIGNAISAIYQSWDSESHGGRFLKYENCEENFASSVTLLQSKGFEFFYSRKRLKPCVFRHGNLPDFVLKMYFKSEKSADVHKIPRATLAAGRIRMAERIREKAYDHKFNITTPEKKAYFPAVNCSGEKGLLPEVIIVSRYIDPTNAVPMTNSQKERLKQFARLAPYPEYTIKENVLAFGPKASLVIIDTEPCGVSLSYDPKEPSYSPSQVQVSPVLEAPIVDLMDGEDSEDPLSEEDKAPAVSRAPIPLKKPATNPMRNRTVGVVATLFALYCGQKIVRSNTMQNALGKSTSALCNVLRMHWVL